MNADPAACSRSSSSMLENPTRSCRYAKQEVEVVSMARGCRSHSKRLKLNQSLVDGLLVHIWVVGTTSEPDGMWHAAERNDEVAAESGEARQPRERAFAGDPMQAVCRSLRTPPAIMRVER